MISLIAVALLVAFIAAGRTVFALGSISRLSAEVRRQREALEERDRRFPTTTREWRGRLKQADTEMEKALWSLSRLDGRLDAASRRVAVQRTQLETFNARYVRRAGTTTRRLRDTARVVKKMLELRRTILG